MNYVVSFLAMAIKFATVFLFGATGEIINQKSGHLNMGTPGIMYLGALGGILGERIYLNSIPADAPLNPFLIVFIPVIFLLLLHGYASLQPERYRSNAYHLWRGHRLLFHRHHGYYAHGRSGFGVATRLP